MRVASALPAATEICYDLGVEPVAVSHECTHPPAAADQPRLNSCVVDPDASSAEINEQVAAAEGDVYEVDREVLAETDPDLLVTQGVCDVCAVDEVSVREAVADLGLDCEILTVDPHSLEDVLGDVVRIGRALNRGERAEDYVTALRARIDAVEAGAARAVDAAGRPRCLVTDWMDPPMVAGHWVPEMVELAGGAYGIADPEAYATPEEWADVRDFDPETLVVAPCGFDVEHTLREVDDLRERPGWADLTAVETGRVYAMDGDVLNCSSPRLVDALEWLAGLLHPEHFPEPPAESYAAVRATTPA